MNRFTPSKNDDDAVVVFVDDDDDESVNYRARFFFYLILSGLFLGDFFLKNEEIHQNFSLFCLQFKTKQNKTAKTSLQFKWFWIFWIFGCFKWHSIQFVVVFAGIFCVIINHFKKLIWFENSIIVLLKNLFFFHGISLEFFKYFFLLIFFCGGRRKIY